MFFQILLAALIGSALADLRGSATYGNTVLKWYSGNQDTTILPGAIALCARKGGEIVMPKDSNLNNAVKSLDKGNIVLLGAGDFTAERYYIWLDGSDMEWSYWCSGEPNNIDNEDCMVQRGGCWNDEKCCSRFGYVCQIPISRVTNEDNEFTLYANDEALTYNQAQEFCRQRRSRLAKITSEDHKTNLLAKINDVNGGEFWVSEDDNADNDYCKSINQKTLVTSDCDQTLPFVCEQAPPYDVKVSDETPFVVETSSLTIDCSASGVPLPTVAWYRNNELVENQTFHEARSTLILNDITSKDADMYVCRAENEIEGKIRMMEGYSFVEVETLNEQ